jgi:hypothetical protein
VLFGLLVSEAVAGNWFTAIVLGIPIVPCILGVGGLLVQTLRGTSRDSSGGKVGPRRLRRR